jgi:insertion element IS1 protein InsB
MSNLCCPQCGLSHIKRNGCTHYGKQNYRCKDCDRQFVEDSQYIGEEMKDLIKVLLLERLSLRGICRVTGVSLTWLLDFITKLYAALPDDLNVTLSQAQKSLIRLVQLEAEADEIWSFVVSKKNKQWVWIALDVTTKQVIAFYVGDRSASSAQELWQRIPQVYRGHATFYTDGLAAYKTVLPSERHQVCAKSSGHTNMIERFNCTLRQRVSRLVRGSLSFSKTIRNHIGAIKYFICHYNKVVIGFAESALHL